MMVTYAEREKRGCWSHVLVRRVLCEEEYELGEAVGSCTGSVNMEYKYTALARVDGTCDHSE
jgi:hypothetical protein